MMTKNRTNIFANIDKFDVQLCTISCQAVSEYARKMQFQVEWNIYISFLQWRIKPLKSMAIAGTCKDFCGGGGDTQRAIKFLRNLGL